MYKKPADIDYCGVDENKIKSAKPKVNLEMLKRYAYYQKERTNIYKNKEILKLQAPWSENPMFQDFKFTMTKRYLDRQSVNLIDGILNRKDVSYDNKLLNCVLFRLTNKWEFFQHIPEHYVDFDNTQADEINKIKTVLESDSIGSMFSDAYFLSGSISAIKTKMYGKGVKGESSPKKSVISLIEYIFLNKEYILETKYMSNPEDMLIHMNQIHGLGTFLNYQIFADWTYIKEFPFSDNSCADCGPGTIRGLDHFFDDFDGLSHKEAVFWVRDNIDRLMKENNLEWDLDSWFDFLPAENRYWGLQDITNSYCEFDKTTRIWDLEGQEQNRKRVRKFKGK